MAESLSVQQQVVRDAEMGDYPFLRQIHEASGFDYKFPDLTDPIFAVQKVVEEDGRVIQGLVLEITASLYLWVDPTWGTPLMRWHRLKAMVAEARKAAWAKGLNSVYAVIPPEIEAEFAPWLKMLGMSRDRDWAKWSINL